MALSPVAQVLAGERPSRLPVWFLRQAGRYLPEYRKIREQMSFLDLCLSPKWAAEVTAQPLRRFDLDAAILFSDILITAVQLGQELTFTGDHGPQLSPPLRGHDGLKGLAAQLTRPLPVFERVCEAVAAIRAQLPRDVLLFGFAGAPLTLAAYMIEGSGSKTFAHLQQAALEPDQLLTPLLELLVEATKITLEGQMRAGAQAGVLFDTWAGALSTDAFRRLAHPSLRQLMGWAAAHNFPLVYYPGAAWHHVPGVLELAPQAIALDWHFTWEQLGQLAPDRQLRVQGNLNPYVLTSPRQEVVEAAVRECLEQAARAGFAEKLIFNVGHGLTPQTRPEAVHWAVTEARKTWEGLCPNF